MSVKEIFSDEDWNKVLEAPLLAGFAVTAADPGGLIGAFQESAAIAKSLKASADAGGEGSLEHAIAGVGIEFDFLGCHLASPGCLVLRGLSRGARGAAAGRVTALGPETGGIALGAHVIVSLIRHLLKPHLRILVFTLTIATFVTITDRFLAAFMYDMSKQLGPYIPLIIVNCIIICRCEVCASKQSVFTALSDAVGVSLGFCLGLASIATVREVLGSGTWMELRVLPET